MVFCLLIKEIMLLIIVFLIRFTYELNYNNELIWVIWACFCNTKFARYMFDLSLLSVKNKMLRGLFQLFSFGFAFSLRINLADI